jgi:hypothetical protein
MSRKVTAIAILLTVFAYFEVCSTDVGHAQSVLVFGSETFVRPSGSQETFVRQIREPVEAFREAFSTAC